MPTRAISTSAPATADSVASAWGCRPDPQTRWPTCWRRPARPPTRSRWSPDHNKARCRAPEGKGLLSVLLSYRYLESSEHLSDPQVLEHAVSIAERYHGPLADDLEQQAVMRWPESVPALPIGRFHQIELYQRGLDRSSRIHDASALDRIPALDRVPGLNGR